MKTLISIFNIGMTLATSTAWADRTEQYQGIAKRGDQIAYMENHTVDYADDGKILRAKTVYSSESGKLLAEMSSDFRESLTVPAHTIKDFRTQGEEGLRRENGKVVLFDHPAGKPEETRIIDAEDANTRMLVGCQGLNYYLVRNLDALEAGKTLPLRFLIPGKLDYYDFDMKEVSKPAAPVVEFEVTIRNWFLSLFAPKLTVKYDRASRRLVGYEGISNLKTDSGDNQKVVIEYRYPSPSPSAVGG